jgi:hypothetical protein
VEENDTEEKNMSITPPPQQIIKIDFYNTPTKNCEVGKNTIPIHSPQIVPVDYHFTPILSINVVTYKKNIKTPDKNKKSAQFSDDILIFIVLQILKIIL